MIWLFNHLSLLSSQHISIFYQDLFFIVILTDLTDEAASLTLVLFIVLIVCIYMFQPLIITRCCDIVKLRSLALVRADRWTSVGLYKVWVLFHQFAKVEVCQSSASWKCPNFPHQPRALEHNWGMNLLKSLHWNVSFMRKVKLVVSLLWTVVYFLL